MKNLTINNHPVSAEDGATILNAAESLGISIPTLCYLKEFRPSTSCMICVVHDLAKDALILSCATMVAEGMVIETDDEMVRESRKDTLDLLLSEHVGDCEAPCRRTCPAAMNIPLMIRQIKEDKFDDAIITVKRDIALPAVLGRICPAPCEKGCHRKQHDNPLSICLLKRFVADVDLALDSPFSPEKKAATGKKVAVIGAGPAGLSAAYYIAQAGHDCRVYDCNEKPGGLLRYGVPDDELPKSVLNAEIELIRALGVEFIADHKLGRDSNLSDLRAEYDAVVLAFGAVDPDVLAESGIETTKRGIAVDRSTFATSVPGVFAGGNAVIEGKMAIRSLAHGKSIAVSVDQFVSGKTVTGCEQRFNSMLGKLQDGETSEFIKESEAFDRIDTAEKSGDGYSAPDAVKESQRCFHCDCRKPESCKLRHYSSEYGADQKRYKFGRRKRFEKTVQHDLVNYESGKCIKCNLCIEITKKAGEKFGFTFINRGFDVKVTVPFDETLGMGLQKAAGECVESCPTAAISWRNGDEESNVDDE